MRKSHVYLAGVALATLGFIATAPGVAQEEGPPAGEAPIDQVAPTAPAPSDLSPDQQMEYNGWAPDQKFAYDAWPAETQAYYWTLSPEQQAMFWQLTDEDKIAITAMTGPERDKAWEMIQNSASGSGDGADTMPPPPGDG